MRRGCAALVGAVSCCTASRRVASMASSRQDDHKPTATHTVAGREVVVSLPPDYDAQVQRRNRLDVVYVIDGGARLFSMVASSGRADHASLSGAEGRQWHPDPIIVGISKPLSNESGTSLTSFVQHSLIPLIDSQFWTKPFAAGRAVCALSSEPGGSSLRKMLVEDETPTCTSLFRFHLLGSAHLAEGRGPAATTLLPEKTAIYLGAAEASPGIDAARSLEQVLQSRSGKTAKETTMFVTRDGEQTYTEKEAVGAPPVTLDVAPAGDTEAAFATNAMVWLGRRLEQQKLESLGSLMPWHEFK
jgi:hypothetical protein